MPTEKVPGASSRSKASQAWTGCRRRGSYRQPQAQVRLGLGGTPERLALPVPGFEDPQRQVHQGFGLGLAEVLGLEVLEPVAALDEPQSRLFHGVVSSVCGGDARPQGERSPLGGLG